MCIRDSRKTLQFLRKKLHGDLPLQLFIKAFVRDANDACAPRAKYLILPNLGT